MAVTKLWKVSVRLGQVLDYTTNPEKTANPEYSAEDYQALKDVLAYAKDEEKTEHEFFCDGINCNVAMARDQFITVKEQFGKTDGIQAYHGYLSFKDEQNITPELAQQIGTEFAKRVWGDRFQVVVTTHLNTKHLHCHFVVNSVSFVDGKRMQNNEKHWRYFRHIADELCRQHQLDVIENPKRGTGKNYYAKKLHEAGMPNYVDSAKAVIDEAISKSNSYADFKYILRQMGASFDDSPNHKYQVLRVKGYQKNIRLTRLGDDYSLERIKERIYENRNRVQLEPFQKGYYYRPKQYVLLTREHMIDDAATAIVQDGEKFRGFLDTQARLDRYSAANALLIYNQYPKATQLKDFGDWAEEKVSINKGAKSISILEPVEYTKTDGTPGVSYNVKKVFDVSQTKGRQTPAPTVNRDPQALVAVMIDTSPVIVEVAPELPHPQMGAFYDNEKQTLFVKKDIGDSVALCQCVAQELGHAQLSIDSDSYSRKDMGFQAMCVGYMLCKKYGVDTKNFAINRIPEEWKNKEPKEIRAELSKTRTAMNEIHSRVSEELYRQKQERSKDRDSR